MARVFDVGGWPVRRLEHARRRIGDLKNSLASYTASNPLGTAPIEVGAGDEAAIHSTKWQPPDAAEFAILIGEAAHSLRSALDSTIWDIVRQSNSGDIGEFEHLLMFPITRRDSKRAWPASAGDKLKGAPPALIDRAGQLQPSKDRSGYALSMLEVLQEINNADKHRLPLAATVTATANLGAELRFNSLVEGREVSMDWMHEGLRPFDGEPESGRLLYEVRVPEFVEYAKINVGVDLQLAMEIPGSEKFPVSELPRRYDFVSSAVSYLYTGSRVHRDYLRSPKAYKPSFSMDPWDKGEGPEDGQPDA
ncbi:hypothetical protein [Demequina lutea]|uniref:Uncharacterized protein n=1 Tax=Demequina lutea TaxID=431489 RepID=A0A7Y9ZAZ9_9MICO|nr:hypothetical protein [Demequina lutea]NYI42082.1 hypothetical protein [Demequina lutea]